MAVAFQPNQVLGRSDLNLFTTDANNIPQNAFEITYSIRYLDPSPPETEVLIGSPTRVPENPSVGEYYAGIQIPSAATLGTYRIRWRFKATAGSPYTEVAQEFAVVSDNTVTGPSPYSSEVMDMIRRFRAFTRDNNPDRNYRFRPPEGERTIGAYNQVFGYVFEDEEIAIWLESALDEWNSAAPETSVSDLDQLVNTYKQWRTNVLWGAVSLGCFALAMNWTQEKFDYSIGGISLSIDKATGYDSLRGSATEKFDKVKELKKETVNITKGLKQQRWGIGIGALGPVTNSPMTPRNFMGAPGF